MPDPLRTEKDLHMCSSRTGAGGGPGWERRRVDIHRQQITFDWVDCDNGGSGRGRISPANRVGSANGWGSSMTGRWRWWWRGALAGGSSLRSASLQASRCMSLTRLRPRVAQP